MADTKISNQTAFTSPPLNTDIIPMVRDPGGTPLSRKITQRNWTKGIGHNVLNYGAQGNGSSDDTSAIQAAINAAMSADGDSKVIFPGLRSYKITSTLTLPAPSNAAGGLVLIGLGGSSQSNYGEPPKIVWGGAAGGTMLDINAVGNLVGFACENLLWAGTGTNDPSIILRLRGAKLDSGTFIRDCWFRSCNGDAISIEVGATNFTIQGGRFDAIYGGYAIHAITGSFVNMTILGNLTYVGGASVQGKGFLFLDGESAGYAHCTINGLHTEINQDLVQSYAAGTNPSDRQGIIRLGVAPASAYVQHVLEITGWQNDTDTGLKSYSCIQVTSTAGTASDAAKCAEVLIVGGGGLNNFNSSDGAATDEIRMFGGNIPADQHWPYLGYRSGLVLWGRGQDSSYEGVRHYINTNLFQFRGLKIESSTFANRNTQVEAGSIAAFTDSNTAVWGATIAGGGANYVLALYNGTNWTVIGK